jgi:vanillate O-demethylase ferredoxin subunit
MTMTTSPLQEVRIATVADEGYGQRALRLEPLHGALPPFEAGAHVDVHLPDGLIRQYSIASAPQQRDHYLLCVRRTDDSRGGSRQLCGSIAPGDRLRISAPRNLFALRTGTRQVLIAAGIGITPLLSMAEALEARGEEFVLHYYVRHREQVAFAARLRQGFRHGRVLLHASADGASPRTHVPVEIRAATSRDQLYLCGPAPFMDRFAALAGGFGWSPAQVHREHFGAIARPAEGERAFEVQLASSGRVVTVPAQVSIAQALRAAGIAAPVSCEQGICGACLTGVLAGEPEHRDSVLGEAERCAGRQLALCCSRSHSPRLVLDL